MDTVPAELVSEQQPMRRPPPGRGRLAVWMTVMVVILLVLGGGLYGFDQFRQAMIAKFFATRVMPPATVSSVVAAAESMPRALDGIGTLAAVHQVTVAPEVGGRVTAILFETGATVKAGAPLVQLNDAPDRADLAADRAQEVYAQLTLDRSKTLAVKSYGTQQSVDQSQSQLDGARAGIAHAEAVIAEKLVRAPFGGQLGVRQIDLGQYLAAGTPVVSLTDLDQLYVNFTLPEQALASLALGQSVTFRVDAFAERGFTGALTAIEPQIDSGTRTIKLQATLPNPDHLLLPGMFAKVQVVLPPEPAVITLPETAVDYSAYGESVFVVHEAAGADGKPVLTAEERFVRTGTRHDGKVAILEGVRGGERVVSAGQVKLHNGATLTLTDEMPLTKPAVTPVN